MKRKIAILTKPGQFKLEDIQKAFEAMIARPQGYVKGIVSP